MVGFASTACATTPPPLTPHPPPPSVPPVSIIGPPVRNGHSPPGHQTNFHILQDLNFDWYTSPTGTNAYCILTDVSNEFRQKISTKVCILFPFIDHIDLLEICAVAIWKQLGKQILGSPGLQHPGFDEPCIAIPKEAFTRPYALCQQMLVTPADTLMFSLDHPPCHHG